MEHEHIYDVKVEGPRTQIGPMMWYSIYHYECECGKHKPPPPPPIQGCDTYGEWLWNKIQDHIKFEEGSNTDDEAIVALLNKEFLRKGIQSYACPSRHFSPHNL